MKLTLEISDEALAQIVAIVNKQPFPFFPPASSTHDPRREPEVFFCNGCSVNRVLDKGELCQPCRYKTQASVSP